MKEPRIRQNLLPWQYPSGTST